MQNRNPQIQREISTACENGLRQQFGPVRGPLYNAVMRYRAGSNLAAEDLRRDLDIVAIPVLEALVRNRVSAPTLLEIRSLMIGSALLGDPEAVIRWATIGRERARQVGGEWTETEPQWLLVLTDPAQFILYSRQIKYFLMQI